MKKLLVLLMVLGLVLTGCSESEKETLKVYNWGEYIDETVITEFEEMYDVRVIYDLFESNEMMYTNLLGGESYDVIIPSDYMIERLIAEDRIQKLDFKVMRRMSFQRMKVWHILFLKKDQTCGWTLWSLRKMLRMLIWHISSLTLCCRRMWPT